MYIYTKPISWYSITLSIKIPKTGSMIEKIDFFLSYYGISQNTANSSPFISFKTQTSNPFHFISSIIDNNQEVKFHSN